MKNTRPKIIGLTGGIGSGKTTVAKFFQEMGFPLYNSDERAKYIQNTNPKVIQEVKTLFGEQAYTAEGLNRSFIASQIFNNKTKLQQLNKIVHPAVFNDFEEWIAQQQTPFVIKEAAILIESGSYKDCDLIITVIADKDVKINRVIQRDNITKEQVLARINNQLSDDERSSFSDYIINNSKDLNYLYNQVEKISKQIKNNVNLED